jgi:hypothetical protein
MLVDDELKTIVGNWDLEEVFFELYNQKGGVL